MRKILSHPNALVIGQNFSYDSLYLFRLWLCKPNLWFDTRTAQRVCFPSMPASLDYLASMYNPDHQYWKDENKEAVRDEDDERRWRYNCRDAVETFAAYQGLEKTIEAFQLTDQLRFEMDLHAMTFFMGQRGIRERTAVVNAMRDDIIGQMLDIEGWFSEVVGTHVGASFKAKPWWRSPKQVSTLLFEWFKVRPMIDRKTKRPSTQNHFFPVYCAREPLLTPILTRLDSYRSKSTFVNNVLNSRRSPERRFITDYTVPGTETLRFASKQNGMGEGLNLQNVPSSYRVIFGPDNGFIWWDADLDRADAQVVAWDSGDDMLKEAFRQGIDIHQLNADTIGCTRDEAKAGVHATNYGGQAHTLSTVLGVSRSDAQYFIDKWFEAHPAIRQWHLRIESEVMTRRYVANKFGFRRQFFERLEDAFTEALAWIPQSTVAVVINKGLLRIYKELMPQYLDENNRYLIEVLTQTHDSGGGQWHETIDTEIRPKVQECLLVPIPYDDPLTIPVGLKTSYLSWGDATESTWEK
jgi:DNA polymerase-1